MSHYWADETSAQWKLRVFAGGLFWRATCLASVRLAQAMQKPCGLLHGVKMHRNDISYFLIFFFAGKGDGKQYIERKNIRRALLGQAKGPSSTASCTSPWHHQMPLGAHETIQSLSPDPPPLHLASEGPFLLSLEIVHPHRGLFLQKHTSVLSNSWHAQKKI